MPRTAEPIKNALKLDATIADKLAEMAERRIKQGKITVGGHPKGLMLQITTAGTSSWLLRTTVNGARREIGLGTYRRAHASDRESAVVSLSEARQLARDALDSIHAGRDPVADRAAARERKMTFQDVAETFLSENEAGWANSKHRQQWRNTLATYVYPKIGNLPIATIDKHAVKAVLMQPKDGTTLWLARHETANRVRQRMEQIFGYARAHDYRTDENPAVWRDNLKTLLGRVPEEIKKVEHHAALSYEEAAKFMAGLRSRKGTGALALQFLILTATRSGEVRLADWSEINLDLALWKIPAARMKKRKQHTVPLSPAALAILEATPQSKRNGLVFPGKKHGKPLSDMTLTAVLKRMHRGDLTAHGFRSMFRDWGGEVSTHPERVLENALAHELDDKTAAAYARGKQLEKRKALMNDWADYLFDTTETQITRD